MADGFRVVWHRVASALRGKGRWAFTIHSANIHCEAKQEGWKAVKARARAGQSFRVKLTPGKSSCVPEERGVEVALNLRLVCGLQRAGGWETGQEAVPGIWGRFDGDRAGGGETG